MMVKRSLLCFGVLLSAFALLAPAAARAQGGAAQAVNLDQVLTYPAGAPEVKVVGSQQKPGVRIDDVTFPSVAGSEPVQAYVVRPESGSGPFAGVLFIHWFAPPEPSSNRTQFLEEAEELARRGTVSLLVSTFWSSEERYRKRTWQSDYENSVNQAKDLRRALDVLLAQPGVDPQRIGLVGHDYGAMFGAVVAAVDPRPKACVLIAGTARFSDWYLFGSSTGVPKGEEREKFLAQLAPIEPVNVIGKAKAPLFFQLGEVDRYTPRKDFIDVYMAAPEAKRIATYKSGHGMEAGIIRFDRQVWLAEHLGLAPPREVPEAARLEREH
jgi:dienelactone hydrolase